MSMQKINDGMRIYAAIVFMIVSVAAVSLPAFSAPAQTQGAAVDTSDPGEIAKGIKQSLPKPGNITVNFKDVDIMTIMHYLSEVSGVDIVPSPGVEGTVTMRLRDKPWEVALDIVTRNYGYVYSRDDEQGIIRVMPKDRLQAEEPVTEVINLNYIVREIELAKSVSSTTAEGISVEEEQQSITQLLEAIDSILNTDKGEKATFIESANAIIVTAIPARISEVKTLIEKVDKKVPQIILDAKVIDIQLTEDERFGIDWEMIFSVSGAKRPITLPFTNEGILRFLPTRQEQWWAVDANGSPQFPPMKLTAMDTAATNDLFTFGTIDCSTFEATLSLLDQRGDTEIISSPRITTLNNQKATIKVIDKIMLQKTQETTQTAGIVTVEFEDEAEAREVGVILSVIPHVNAEGDISVNLLPEVSSDAGFTTQSVAGGTQSTVALTITSREANTTVRVKDGDTIFIGGLISNNVEKTDHRVPLLGDLLGGIPIVGNVFKYEAEDVTKTEIAFFITVHLVDESMETIEKTDEMAHYKEFFSRKDNDAGTKDVTKGDLSKQEKKTEEGAKDSDFSAAAIPDKKVPDVTVPDTTVPDAVIPETAVKKKKYVPILDFRK